METVSEILPYPPPAYEWVFEEGADCAKLHDREGRILAVSRSGMCSLELDDLSQIQGLHWAEIWPAEMRERVESALCSARAGQVSRFTAFCPTAKGTPKWWNVFVAPVFDNDGQVDKILTVGSDITELQRTKEAMREQIARKEFLLQASGVGEWDLDLVTGTVQRSLQHDRCFGYKDQVAEWSMPIFLRHVHPGDRQQVTEQLERATREKGAIRFECRVIWPDRSVHWIRLEGAPYRPEGTGPNRVIGTITDVTGRKRAEALANGQRKALELAVAGAPLTDVLDVLTSAAETATGDTIKASVLLVDKNGQNLRHGSAPSLPAAFSKVLDGVPIAPPVGPCGTAAGTACEVLVKDIATDRRWQGFDALALPFGLRSCWSQPILSPRGQVLGTMAAYRDIPWEPDAQDREALTLLVHTAALVLDRHREAEERSAAELALRKSEAHLSSLFGQSMAGIAEMDLSGRFIEVNQRCCELVGRSPEALVGLSLADITHPEDVARTLQLFSDLVTTGKPFEIEKRCTRPDGSYAWITAAVSRIHASCGSSQSVLAVLIDTSDRKQAEENLRAADRRKDEFLAMLAHELRNPLAPIAAAADLLASCDNEPGKVRRSAEVISRQARHMTGLIDDLLDVSRVTRGLVKLEQKPLHVEAVVAEAVEQVRPLIEARKHRIGLTLQADNAYVRGDKKRLVQVIANLLTNSAKYTPEAGTIALSMSASETEVILSVQDNGIGMEPELLRHVFEPFVQAQRSVDRSQGGLGIGLALVKSLVELHGGTVAANSRGAGEGSEFTLTLPRMLPTPDDVPPVRAELSPPGTSSALRLLVVDDNADAAQMMGMLLEASGHQVSVVHDPSTALARVQAAQADACLLDIGLPGMDGYELARKLRASPGARTAMLIAITGYSQSHDRDKALAAGFDHYLVKPVDMLRLRAILDTVPQPAHPTGPP